MRDNFRPNVRLTTNILMVIGTFLIAINLTSGGKQDKEYIKRRDACADYIVKKIDMPQFMEIVGVKDKPNRMETKLEFYCSIYGLRNTHRYKPTWRDNY